VCTATINHFELVGGKSVRIIFVLNLLMAFLTVLEFTTRNLRTLSLNGIVARRIQWTSKNMN
jgi:hypothetical protein